ncbi:TetR/AcrR family transcriptional regulator [Actinomadura kijaniata]|uniref:TetR/AcrR family transcriptional regulator n=1 Tax=Actinomadura kijaniata TaxID=46161 RepID=UPI00082D29D5|nr:TetR/AcrR family transcriptional regulator [Actinomadura kijaniata]
MRSTNDDRTARAVIRDEALRLFAEHGPDTVTVRRVAAAAGVSPGLVIHHFGTKDGLREEVDRHVVETFDGMLGELTADSSGGGSLAAALLRYLPPDSPIPDYLRGLLLGDGEAGRALFRRLFEVSRARLDAMPEDARGPDPAVRAAFLTVNDLAMILLRDRITDVLGLDPLSTEGLVRWTSEAMLVYTRGLRP